MDHRKLNGALSMKLKCVVAATILLAGAADVSNGAPARVLSKPADDPRIDQSKKMESTAQISATVESPQCYENIGCPHKDHILKEQIEDFSCENLWLVRNTIFTRGVTAFKAPVAAPISTIAVACRIQSLS